MSASASVPVQVRLPVGRSRLALGALVLAFFVLIGRSVYLQSVKTGFLQEKGEARYSRVLEIPGTRGRILDRHGEALAISTPVKSIWAIPDDVKATPAQMRGLAALLGQDSRELERRITSAERDFVYLKRQLPPETAARVAELGIPGIHQHSEFRRYYPGGETVAHIVGFTGVNDAGQEGIELAHQADLAGMAGSRRVIKDRMGRIVEDVESIRAAQDGKDLTLSIDNKIQSLAFGVLKSTVAANKAKAGAVVVLDVRTGEVLALANVPTYNPNNRARLTGAQLRNRVMTDTFEPGSTLKPFTMALALETGRLTPTTVISTAPGTLKMGGFTIKDTHKATSMTALQAIQWSSNVALAKTALGMPREEMHAMFRNVGFGNPPRLGFPGEAAGRLREAKTWRPVEQATMAYGHGISVSLAQLARAYIAFARDGEVMPLSLLRVAVEPAGSRVFSPETARAMREMLEAAVQPGGTAPRARIAGWRVAGKTGTAHKLENGVYTNKYVSSFVGFAPVSAPRLVIAVMIDEPGAGQHYGGQVAAPLFGQVMQGALRLLAVPHDAPLAPIELPASAEEALEET